MSPSHGLAAAAGSDPPRPGFHGTFSAVSLSVPRPKEVLSEHHCSSHFSDRGRGFRPRLRLGEGRGERRVPSEASTTWATNDATVASASPHPTTGAATCSCPSPLSRVERHHGKVTGSSSSSPRPNADCRRSVCACSLTDRRTARRLGCGRNSYALRLLANASQMQRRASRIDPLEGGTARWHARAVAGERLGRRS